VDVYLVDGTYELFRHFYGVPSHVNREGLEVAATLGVVRSVLGMLERGTTHVGVATDHVVESFRNDMWPTYKTSAGMPPEILNQFQLLEDALAALGVVVWPMVEMEADDALGTAAYQLESDSSVDRVLICTPDKDLGQCVRGERVVQLDRRAMRITNEGGVQEKFGVRPASIADYLALVGDTADGFPGLPGWGAKTAAAVLSRFEHLEGIPPDPADWDVAIPASRRATLAKTLWDNVENALLFRDLATVRTNAPIAVTPDKLRWMGPSPELGAIAERLEAADLVPRANALMA